MVEKPFRRSSRRVALEALLAGTPVVVTSRGGLPEIVDDGITGFVVAPDPQKIARAVIEVLRTPDMLRKVENARPNLEGPRTGRAKATR